MEDTWKKRLCQFCVPRFAQLSGQPLTSNECWNMCQMDKRMTVKDARQWAVEGIFVTDRWSDVLSNESHSSALLTEQGLWALGRSFFVPPPPGWNVGMLLGAPGAGGQAGCFTSQPCTTLLFQRILTCAGSAQISAFPCVASFDFSKVDPF